MNDQALTSDTIKRNQKILAQLFSSKGVANQNETAFYIPNSNEFLLEYTERMQSMRYHLTGFTGSTGESVMLPNGEIWIVVDGRYQVQADREVIPLGVKVVKAPTQVELITTLVDHLKKAGIKNILMVADRTSWSDYLLFQKLGLTTQTMDSKDLAPYFDLYSLPDHAPSKVVFIDPKILNENFQTRSPRVAKTSQQALFLSQGDDISWLTQCVGELSNGNRSNLLAKSLWMGDEVVVLLPPNYELSTEVKNLKNVKFIVAPLAQWSKIWGELLLEKIKNETISEFIIDQLSATLSDVLCWKSLLDSHKVQVGISISPVAKAKRLKNSQERRHLEDINLRASVAVADTLRWILAKSKNNEEIYEVDYKNYCEAQFKKQGACGQSFTTISAFGSNSSLSHYGLKGQGAKLDLTNGDVALLDAGGQFAAGFVTDLTRTLMIAPEKMRPERRAAIKRAFTLVLKAQINGESSVFPEGTAGSSIDYRVRAPMYAQGLNFKHGTGHGVGFNVHEWGGRITVWSQDTMNLGQVSSIEPGYYLDEQWGIRHENLAIVERHPNFPDFCRFAPLVFIGWQEEAIDWDLFTQDELAYFKEYQSRCQKLGTAL
ncbi:MAG: M24 family metallopeptidase [Bacteriovoracaceae bacterium]|nr:M24 family metallopeptidase [Bacteriovoracaceae bacterium]